MDHHAIQNAPFTLDLGAIPADLVELVHLVSSRQAAGQDEPTPDT